jgi:hypothetical protein
MSDYLCCLLSGCWIVKEREKKEIGKVSFFRTVKQMARICHFNKRERVECAIGRRFFFADLDWIFSGFFFK